MSLKRVFLVLAAVGLIASTGCANRNNQNANNSTPYASSHYSSIPGVLPGSTPGSVPSYENSLDEFRSDLEEGISRIEDELSRRDEHAGLESIYDEYGSSYNDHYGSSYDNYRYESGYESHESARAAMSTDFEQIGALSSEKKGWGPGLNADKDNRPLGAVDYQQKYGDYGSYFIAPNSSKIYLTFDEGYENGYTGDILDTLREKNVKAVFFITYDFAKSAPELVKRMVSEGHILGNHSTRHKSFPDLTPQEMIEDVTKLHDYVKANFGYTMSLFRPPMGEFSEQSLAVLRSMGYSTVFWSVAYRDWDPDDQPLTIEALNTLTSRCHPGAIYLLHAVSKTNSEILGELIDAAHGKGYEFTRWDWA